MGKSELWKAFWDAVEAKDLRVGLKVAKYFKNVGNDAWTRVFKGEVTEVWKNDKGETLYHVKYDNDEEDLNESEVRLIAIL